MKQIFYDVIEYNWVKDLMIDCKNLDQQKKKLEFIAWLHKNPICDILTNKTFYNYKIWNIAAINIKVSPSKIRIVDFN